MKNIRYILLIGVSMLSCLVYSFGIWSEARLESLLRNSGRFAEDDYDNEGEEDVPNWERDALPLFHDVFEESGWTTNQLVQILINIASNGLSSASWGIPEKRRSAVVAFSQLADINHPLVTNFFHNVIGMELHGLESIALPALFRYTHLEPVVFNDLYCACSCSNSYDKAAPLVALGLLDGIDNVPIAERGAAKIRVAKFMYFSSRQITSSQTWQDEQLAKLIPDYSNSVQRLEQVRYLMLHSSRSYERKKATEQFNRLNAIPTNSLKDISWILPDN